ncbi:hypothetical protein ACRALDRAFT_1064891 [Sodiomyces alcalophilus JCM 7366]|uniref:uncharacterized protein n=1 Tax=Sodiomyces alcalophilus JCM 7366 TaxID=591952 RepID=UPI0039B4499B
MLFDQIIPLSDDIQYWEETLGSYTYTILYTIQTSPLHLWDAFHKIRCSVQDHIGDINTAREPPPGSTWKGLVGPWVQFYGIVQRSVRERSLATIRGKVLSPVSRHRREVRRHLAELNKLKDITSTGLGMLVDEGLAFGMDQDDAKSDDEIMDLLHWKPVVSKTVAMMDAVLDKILELDSFPQDFETTVFRTIYEDAELGTQFDDPQAPLRVSAAAQRLLYILEHKLPQRTRELQHVVREHGRPSAIVRYWLPATLAALSSTTVLRILVNRKAELATWARDIAVTARDFWANWVIQPVRNMVRTIRHDEASEIAIMSRDSLKADRESLERMVIDFALDNPHFAGSSGPLTDAQVAGIRAKVYQGDLTPVLRAYETDLRRPFRGAVRGDLVRSLLIQVQKTKVDLEVAVSGIDALLRSQELVFALVGLTPGILVTAGVVQHIRGVFGGRRGARNQRQGDQVLRIMLKIDRILTEATPTANEFLHYRDHGRLLCEVHVLRNVMSKVLPRHMEKEFLKDLEDLASPKRYPVQVQTFSRMKWAYAKWIR